MVYRDDEEGLRERIDLLLKQAQSRPPERQGRRQH
jgi:hypothetical protein